MLKNIIVRLVVYYAAWLLALSGIFHLFPEILHYVALERGRIFVARGLVPGSDNIPFPLGDIERGVSRLVDPTHTIPVVVAMVLAFAVTLPIAWVYCWTRPRKKYNRAFAQTLLVVPISIALVVFLVKGSLALAFSLAGIVAAVRFRTSLDEPIDAVYMFMAIGIGLAAGTQLTTVAYLASLTFVAVTLAVWKVDFGSQPAVLSGWRIVTPGEPTRQSGAEATETDWNSRIEVHTSRVDAARKAATPALNASARHWQVAAVRREADGSALIVIDARLRKAVKPTSLAKEIRKAGKDNIHNVEVTDRSPDSERVDAQSRR